MEARAINNFFFFEKELLIYCVQTSRNVIDSPRRV